MSSQAPTNRITPSNEKVPLTGTGFTDDKRNDAESFSTTAEQTEPHEPDSATHPEGGWRAWGVVLGSWLATFSSMGLMNSIGSFQAYLSRNQLSNYEADKVAWIFGVYSGVTFLAGVQVGPIFDARGPRGLMLAGGMGTVLYLLLLGLCTQYWHFMLVFGVLGGISLSLVFGPAIAIVAHYFHRRRGLATGIASSGSSFGGLAIPLMLENLFTKIGFAWTTRVMALICLVTSIIALVFIRRRFPTKPITMSKIRPDITAFSRTAFTFTSLGVFFMEWGLFIPLSYLTSYGLDQGLSSQFSSLLLALINGCAVFGRWIPGYYADRYGRFNVLIITIVGCVLSNACLWLTAGSSEALLTVFAVVFGFFSGGNLSLAPVCVGQLCKLESYGRYYATAYLLVSIRYIVPSPDILCLLTCTSTLTGIPIAGELLKRCDGSYYGVIAFTVASYVASFFCLVTAKICHCGIGKIWCAF